MKNRAATAIDPSGLDIHVYYTQVFPFGYYHVSVVVFDPVTKKGFQFDGLGPQGGNLSNAVVSTYTWPKLNTPGSMIPISYAKDINRLYKKHNPNGPVAVIKTDLTPSEEIALLKKIHSKLLQHPTYNSISGPNSNTYAYQLLYLAGKEKTFSVPNHLPGVPGWANGGSDGNQLGYGMQHRPLPIDAPYYDEWGKKTYLTQAQKDAIYKSWLADFAKANADYAKWKGGRW